MHRQVDAGNTANSTSVFGLSLKLARQDFRQGGRS